MAQNHFAQLHGQQHQGACQSPDQNNSSTFFNTQIMEDKNSSTSNDNQNVGGSNSCASHNRPDNVGHMHTNKGKQPSFFNMQNIEGYGPAPSHESTIQPNAYAHDSSTSSSAHNARGRKMENKPLPRLAGTLPQSPQMPSSQHEPRSENSEKERDRNAGGNGVEKGRSSAPDLLSSEKCPETRTKPAGKSKAATEKENEKQQSDDHAQDEKQTAAAADVDMDVDKETAGRDHGKKQEKGNGNSVFGQRSRVSSDFDFHFRGEPRVHDLARGFNMASIGDVLARENSYLGKRYRSASPCIPSRDITRDIFGNPFPQNSSTEVDSKIVVEVGTPGSRRAAAEDHGKAGVAVEDDGLSSLPRRHSFPPAPSPDKLRNNLGFNKSTNAIITNDKTNNAHTKNNINDNRANSSNSKNQQTKRKNWPNSSSSLTEADLSAVSGVPSDGKQITQFFPHPDPDSQSASGSCSAGLAVGVGGAESSDGKESGMDGCKKSVKGNANARPQNSSRNNTNTNTNQQWLQMDQMARQLSMNNNNVNNHSGIHNHTQKQIAGKGRQSKGGSQALARPASHLASASGQTQPHIVNLPHNANMNNSNINMNGMNQREMMAVFNGGCGYVNSPDLQQQQQQPHPQPHSHAHPHAQPQRGGNGNEKTGTNAHARGVDYFDNSIAAWSQQENCIAQIILAQEQALVASQPDRDYTISVVQNMITNCFGEEYSVALHGSHKYGIATVFSDVDLMIQTGRSPSMCSVDSRDSSISQGGGQDQSLPVHAGWERRFEKFLATWNNPTICISELKVVPGHLPVVRFKVWYQRNQQNNAVFDKVEYHSDSHPQLRAVDVDLTWKTPEHQADRFAVFFRQQVSPYSIMVSILRFLKYILHSVSVLGSFDGGISSYALLSILVCVVQEKTKANPLYLQQVNHYQLFVHFVDFVRSFDPEEDAICVARGGKQNKHRQWGPVVQDFDALRRQTCPPDRADAYKSHEYDFLVVEDPLSDRGVFVFKLNQNVFKMLFKTTF